jgi:plastocyanin
VPDRVPTAPTVRRPWRRPAALLIAVSLAALGACGSDDDGGDTADDTGGAAATTSSAPSSPAATESSEAPSSPSETGSETQSLVATEVDFGIEVADTDLTAGTYEIEVVNDGGATHDLVVERDGEDVDGTGPINPGESATLTVPLEPGEYVFYCSIANHRAMGMEITVTVT